jgi:O-antigen ligase
MKEIFFIKDSIENKISYYHLLFFLLALPFDRLYSTIILVSFLVHTLIFFHKKKFRGIGSSILILQSVFIVTIVSATYAAFVLRGLDVASKQLAIFLFPLLFAVTSLDLAKYRSRLLQGFALGCTLTVLYLFFDALHVLWYNKLPFAELFSSAFVNHNFSLPIDMHATYLSLLLIISIVYLLQQLFAEQTKTKRAYFITCSAILLAGLIQLSSKSAFIALLLILVIGFPWFLVKKEKRRRFLLISLAACGLLLTLILSVDVFRNRYIIMFTDDLYENTGITENNSRIDRWNVAIDLVKRSPVTGTGSGSEIPLLRDLYFERKMYGSYLVSVNAHNQYLSFMITSGIIGLLVYLGTLCWGFWQSLKDRDILMLSFLVLVTVVSFSEDLLDVNKGIFFYAFFFSFFIMSRKKVAL